VYGLTVAVLVIVFPRYAQPWKGNHVKEKFLGFRVVPFTGVFVFIWQVFTSGLVYATELLPSVAAATLLICPLYEDALLF